MRPASRRWIVLVVALVLLGSTGCVSIPTSGPVEKVEGQQPACQSCVNVEVAPPAPGDSPRQIVDGFLRANANYQPGYAVARQFLTKAAAEAWSPDQGVTIYSGSPVQAAETVVLKGKVVGALSEKRIFSARDLNLSWDFKVEQQDGQWRIAQPPSDLFVRDSSFETLYRSYDLHFVGSTGALVPEPIYLPDLRAPGNVASALVTALLDGPSDWLSPAVTTAVPPNTSLSVDSVTIVNGVAQVPLSETLLQTTDAARSLLAAQLVYTLQQVTGVTKVLLQVNNQPFRVPQSETGDLAVPLENISAELNPVPFVPAEQLYAVRRGDQSLERVNSNAEVPTTEPFPGALGTGRHDVSTLAVSVTNTDLAVVTDLGTRLRRTPTSETKLTTVLDGVSGLLRPQFTRTGELYAVGERGGRQRMWVSTDGRTTEVAAPDLFDQGRVLAFRVSPDGARMALVVKSRGRTRLGLARVVRSARVSVEGWRELRTDRGATDGMVGVVRDLAWTNATQLMVLGADTAGGPFVPSTVSIDGSEIDTEPQTNDWDAVELTVLLRTQTAIPIVLARDGRCFRDDGTQWQLLLSEVAAIAYPG
jgi:hypothetical protein